MTSRFCPRCGTPVGATAKFCAECGHSLTGDSRGEGRRAPPGIKTLLQWMAPGAVIVVAIAYVIGTRTPPTSAALTAQDGGIVPASDISTLSPDERVDRLFNRVMSLAERGEADSVAFFAPMAVSSFAALEPLSAHRRYDLGLVLLVSGDREAARAQVDTVLATAPTHLLALALGMRVAGAAGDSATARTFGARLKRAVTAERAKALPEYSAHASEIDAALAEADASRPGRPSGAG